MSLLDAMCVSYNSLRWTQAASLKIEKAMMLGS